MYRGEGLHTLPHFRKLILLTSCLLQTVDQLLDGEHHVLRDARDLDAERRAAGAERRLGELATQLRSECKQLQMNDTGWPLEQLLAEALGGSSSSSDSDSDSEVSSESGGDGKEQKQLITELD